MQGRPKKIGICVSFVLKGGSRVQNFNCVCNVFPMTVGKLE